MTPLRRTHVRFLALILAASILCPAANSLAAPVCFAYVPTAIWGQNLAVAASPLSRTRDGIYWFDGEGRLGTLIGDPERYQALDATAAPKEGIVAFRGRYLAYPSNSWVMGVAVMDTAGALVADFPRGQSFKWSPDGSRLAVVYEREAAGRAREAVGKGRKKRSPSGGVRVWDRREGTERTYAQWPSRVGWAGSDSLLLQLPDKVVVLDLRKGGVAKTGHHGTVVSGDGRYSMWPGENGQDTRILEDETGLDITERLFGPLRREGLTEIRSAFWIRGSGMDHYMCVSGSDLIAGQDPRCVTLILDAESGEEVDRFPGEALGPTADGRRAVLLLHDEGQLKIANLRSAVLNWGGGSGEFH